MMLALSTGDTQQEEQVCVCDINKPTALTTGMSLKSGK